MKYKKEDLVNYKIAILCGGSSNESDLSLDSGERIFNELKNCGLDLDLHKIDLNYYDILNLKKDGFDLVFNILIGSPGEDGTIQGLLDTMNIKYTGCKTLQSALTLNKELTKKIWRSSNVPTAKSIVLTKEDINDLDKIVEELEFPMFVKPNIEGSSIGATKVKTKGELSKALKEISKVTSTILCEEFLDGKEYSVPILNGKALMIVEIEPSDGQEFFNYHAKHVTNGVKYHCPAKLNSDDMQKITKIAEDAVEAIGIKSWCRVDILANSMSDFFAVEINSNPGMAYSSIFPFAVEKTGIKVSDLCIHLLVDAINDVENN